MHPFKKYGALVFKMACFITPLITGILISLIRRLVRNNRLQELELLEYMLVGGSIVLAAEHVLSGEISPYPPFLTAFSSRESFQFLIREVALIGASMSAAVLTIWTTLTVIMRNSAGRLLVRGTVQTRDR